MAARVLFLINVQNDFFPGGAFSELNVDGIVPYMNNLMRRENYDHIIGTMDWHPEGHVGFYTSHETDDDGNPAAPFGKKSVTNSKGSFLQIMWPVHGLAGTTGAEFFNGKMSPPDANSEPLYIDKITMQIHKGLDIDIDTYSAFGDNPITTADGKEYKRMTGLHYWVEGLMKEHSDIEFHFCGVGIDNCVMFTIVDLLNIIKNKNRHKIIVHKNGCGSMLKDQHAPSVKKLADMGCEIV